MLDSYTALPDLSLRHLKAALVVSRTKNLTRAASQLNRSQTALTKGIKKLEAGLGVRLFERTSCGMQPTAYCELLASSVERAERELMIAGQAYTRYKPGARNHKRIAMFSMEVSCKRLSALIALHEHRDVNLAALRLGIGPPAVYKAVRESEALLEMSLFERGPTGMTGSAYCDVLVRQLKLVFKELRQLTEDIASLRDGGATGTVSIGTLPYSRSILTPRAINRLLEVYPALNITTTEGPYVMQEAALRCGELDFIVGALREGGDAGDFSTEKLLTDRLSIIARKGHPLVSRRKLQLSNLLAYHWVLPAAKTPARGLFDQVLEAQGLDKPERFIESSSLSMVRGLLTESDRLALLSEHQIYYERKFGQLCVLPIELPGTYRSIGITIRARTELSIAAKAFLECLREVALELQGV
ncbi:LysR family transcriptional regulator [Parahaliea mediterranea]|uniref:LysR family transcriptional regulator n=1 Tax=Parahaliea mediterranea TaxID=651086 RepID=A0A939IJD9_9GAMM|nr:LysR family transcriptional regulator [Parahaliea mediterranea]MBN7796186.1 LysR family transcriptional regulator [Parahaliea mediterranea]